MHSATAHHTAVTVSDLERAIDFYTEALGLDVADRFEVGGEAFATAVDEPGATGSFAHLDADGVLANEESQGSVEERSESTGVRLELVSFEPEGEARDEGALAEPGTSHVGFEVDDVDAAVAALPDAARLVSEPQTTESGARVVFFRDPEGNLVELLEP